MVLLNKLDLDFHTIKIFIEAYGKEWIDCLHLEKVLNNDHSLTVWEAALATHYCWQIHNKHLVSDYGQKDNADLAERFGVKVTDDYKDHPVIKLFLRDKDDPITYDGDYTLDSLRKFIASDGGRLV